jgi:hypothetical protein
MEIDVDLLKQFEEQLNTLRPEKSPIPAKLVGLGRISATYEILEDGQELAQYTRMPYFDTMIRLDAYEKLYHRYNQQMKEIGIDLPDHGTTRIQKRNGQTVLYLFREKQPANATAIGVVSRATNAQCFAVARQILREMNKAWKFNGKNRSKLEVSVDGRLSNWSIPGIGLDISQVDTKTKLQCIPNGTPMMRQGEKELLDSDLFFLRASEVSQPISKRRHMRDLLGRFYDMRRACMDMLADFREIRGKLVTGVVDVANQFLLEEAAVEHLLAITPEDVKQYKADALAWKL